MTADTERDALVAELQRAIEDAYAGPKRTRPGAYGQTIEASLKGELRQVTAFDLDVISSAADQIRRDRERIAELEAALAQAAVPLEGLTLAAHMAGSNMGLCKGSWDEINNAVQHIRAALAKAGGRDGSS